MQKYLFNMSFDPDAEKEPEAPSFSEDEIAAAKQAAYAEGQQAGMAEATNSLNQQIQMLSQQINLSLIDLMTRANELEQAKTKDAARLALAIANKLVPDLFERQGTNEIEAMIRECLVDARSEPRLVIRIHESLVEEMDTRISALAAGAGFQGQVTVLGVADLTPQDCVVEWADGGAERSIEAIWNDIYKRCERAVPDSSKRPPAPEPQEEPEQAIEEASAEEAQPEAFAPEEIEQPAAAEAPAPSPVAEQLDPIPDNPFGIPDEMTEQLNAQHHGQQPQPEAPEVINTTEQDQQQ